MGITIKEFKENYLPELRQQFHSNVAENIINNREAINGKIMKQIKAFIAFSGKFQKQVPLEFGEIQIALLHTSVYLGKPQICISAYDYKGIYGNEILNVKFDAEWLFYGWEDYRRDIKNKIEEIHACNVIRDEAIRQMMHESMTYMVTMLYAVTKYLLMEYDRIEGYDEMILTDVFRLSVGSYRDWSRVLFIKRNEEDIFFREKKIPLQFCVFNEAVYSRKEFAKVNLNHTRFINCEFIQCNFKDVELNDTIFENCRIYQCSFDNAAFLGTTMRRVTMKKDSFKNVVWHCIPSFENQADVYKNAELTECILEYITFEKSDLRKIKHEKCIFKDINIYDCEKEEEWNTIC